MSQELTPEQLKSINQTLENLTRAVDGLNDLFERLEARIDEVDSKLNHRIDYETL